MLYTSQTNVCSIPYFHSELEDALLVLFITSSWTGCVFQTAADRVDNPHWKTRPWYYEA